MLAGLKSKERPRQKLEQFTRSKLRKINLAKKMLAGLKSKERLRQKLE